MKPLYAFRSADGNYGLTLPSDVVMRMLSEARRAGRHETGGILIGLYNDALDTAMVTQAAPPPPDSKGTLTTFWRGVSGIRELLQRLWGQPIRTFYLGEWHVHPGFSAYRSLTDDRTMRDDALKRSFGCAAPVLVILGGDVEGEWHLSACAYPTNGDPVALTAKGDEDER